MEKQEIMSEKGKDSVKKLSEAGRRKRNMTVVYLSAVMLFIGSMWLIFAPSMKADSMTDANGFNVEMPEADEGDRSIIGDKVKAYVQDEMTERQENRNNAMRELGDMFNNDSTSEDYGETERADDTGKDTMPQSVRSSATAYQELNATLGDFYEQHTDSETGIGINSAGEEDTDREILLQRIASLESALDEERTAGNTSSVDAQVALMEKSYELAARYMGGERETSSADTVVTERTENMTMPVSTTAECIAVPASSSYYLGLDGQCTLSGFHTAVGGMTATDKNTVNACVYGAQTVTDGQAVRLRLLEDMSVAGRVIPRNAVLSGFGRVQGERLGINITSVEYAGTIIPVKLLVYDTDGQQGIHIPNSMELDAAKEIAANMGSSLGSSINISTNAGAQLASDLGRGLIQGTSQYVAKKVRTVRVHLKAGYKVMLYQEK
ncbi:MAG: conjugative transposon protein TraM [Prevotella sp.]|nr:conjugative transposon protein TraM [Prevotella sp.]